MNTGKYALLIPVALFFYLLATGYKIINPLPLTYDPALHAEIAGYVIPEAAIPDTWKPLADVAYTYPPLFHWLAFLFSLTGVETYRVVVLMGLFLYALFPVAFYLYGLAFGKKEAVMFSFFGAIQASLVEVFAAGEYPQLLSMNLLLIALYFLSKKSYGPAAIFSGLVALSHTFTALYMAALVAIYYLSGGRKANTRINTRHILTFLPIFLIVSSAWVPKYIQITDNAINHRWENTIWYYGAGLIDAEKINGIFFSLLPGSRIGLIMFLLSAAGLAYAYRRKACQSWIFLFTTAFVLFHIPGTQYKFLDMLAIAVPPVAASGVTWIIKKTGGMQSLAKILLAAFLSAFLLVNPYANATNLRNCCVSDDVPSGEKIKLAEWLKTIDGAPSILIADGKYEAWFAVIAEKYPMNPRVSELEVFTNRYREMITDRQTLLDELGAGKDPKELLDKWDVNYIVTSNSLNVSGFRLAREENGAKLYKRYP